MSSGRGQTSTRWIRRIPCLRCSHSCHPRKTCCGSRFLLPSTMSITRLAVPALSSIHAFFLMSFFFRFTYRTLDRLMDTFERLKSEDPEMYGVRMERLRRQGTLFQTNAANQVYAAAATSSTSKSSDAAPGPRKHAALTPARQRLFEGSSDDVRKRKEFSCC